MRQLHELLWYLTEALALAPARAMHDELAGALAETERLTDLDPDALLASDVAAHRARVNGWLLRTSELVRTGVAGTANTAVPTSSGPTSPALTYETRTCAAPT